MCEFGDGNQRCGSGTGTGQPLLHSWVGDLLGVPSELLFKELIYLSFCAEHF